MQDELMIRGFEIAHPYIEIYGHRNNEKSSHKVIICNCLIFSDPAEARTLDPQIKSLLLYQLSYGVKRTANVNTKEFARKSVYTKNNFIFTGNFLIHLRRKNEYVYEQPHIYYDKT